MCLVIWSLLTTNDLEALASDRDIWKTVCDTGLRSFVDGWITTSEERRAARHNFHKAEDRPSMS